MQALELVAHAADGIQIFVRVRYKYPRIGRFFCDHPRNRHHPPLSADRFLVGFRNASAFDQVQPAGRLFSFGIFQSRFATGI